MHLIQDWERCTTCDHRAHRHSRYHPWPCYVKDCRCTALAVSSSSEARDRAQPPTWSGQQLAFDDWRIH